MTTRTVTDTILRGDETPYANEPVTFYLRAGAFTETATYPPQAVTVQTDTNGSYSVALWTNADGLTASTWVAFYPDKETIEFVLQPSASPITMAELRAAEVYDWNTAIIPSTLELERARYADTNSLSLGDTLVGTRAPRTGAVARTVHDKLADTHHVADFGIFPTTAAAANTTAMQSALTAIGNAGGGVLTLGAGTYSFSGRLIVPDGVTLSGAGVGVTVLDFTAAADGALAASGSVEYASCIAVIGGGSTALPALASDVAQNAITLTFVSSVSATIAAGDVLKIHNPADWSHNYFRSYYHAGEFVYVLSVAGAVVTLARPTYAAYDKDDVNLYRCTFAKVTLRDLTIVGKEEPAGVDPATLYFSYAAGLLLENVVLHGSDFAHVLLQHCAGFTVAHARARYYSDFGGTNYGVNVNNSQDGLLIGCEFAVTRHAITHGGSHAQGVPTRNIRVEGGRWEGRGSNTVGAIAYHGNCERNLVVGAEIINGVTMSGDYNEIRASRIQTGYANVAVGGSEQVGNNITLDGVTIDVMAPLLNDAGSAQGAIHLSLMSSHTRGGTFRLWNTTVNMNGYAGEPIEVYNISEAAINFDVRNFSVINANRASGTSLMYFRCGAGHRMNYMEFSGVRVDGVDLRLDGCGPALARWVNYVATNPTSNGISVLPNSLSQSTYQHRATEGGVVKKLAVSYNEFAEQVTETSSFTLQTGDAVYFSYSVPFSNVAVTMATLNTNAATATWEYWNGTAWAALSGVTDGMVSAGRPFAQNGTVSWTIPGDWAKAYILGETRDHARLYWMRARTSATLTSVALSTMVTSNLTQPTTAEAFELIDCYITGAAAAGAFIDGTSQAFSTLRIHGGSLANNGSVIGGGSSSKTSIFLRRFLRAVLDDVELGDTRAPSGTGEASTSLYRADDVTHLDVRSIKNVNSAGLSAVSETNATRWYPGVRAYRTAATSPANATWTALSLALESYDPDALHDLVTNPSRITIKTSAPYLITGQISFANNTTGNRGVRIRRGGATVIAQELIPACTGTDTTDITVSTQVYLNFGEYIELQAYQSSGASLALNIDANYANALMLQRIG